MIPVLLWIFGCYALAVAAVHAAYALTWKRQRDVQHYVLIAGNHQLQMEWYMRSLRRFSHFTGTEVKVTVVDRGSQDETLGIARYFARMGMNVDFHSSAMQNEPTGSVMHTRGRFASVKGHAAEATGDERSGKEAVRSDLQQNADKGPKPDVKAQGPDAEGKKPNARNGHGPSKWQRFRVSLGKSRKLRVKKQSASVEPTNLLWMLQAEGIVSAKDHAVLIDLRNPADLSKLPY
ncbi:hypothetical protein [Paenibacillus albus]|uniref:Glycosyltransferase n=1 Tax=Paenibacillus albus TaxID=2495582 RepID=A0A3S8ZYJ0_9BACL|nr:hypothetical protein [Paenibacillus albus]AZN38532.1 hypothetical protein EJC50_01735 [Paenibacillus albus]